MSIPEKLRQIEVALQNVLGPVGLHRTTEAGLVQLSEVCFVESAGRHGTEKKIRYVTADGRSHPAKGYLKEVEEVLTSFPAFVRTASNFLVNLDRVKSIHQAPAQQGYRLGFDGFEETALVSTNRKEWVDAVKDYLGLPTLDHVVPYSDLAQALRDLDIHEYPDDLRFQTKDFYREHFSDGAGNIIIAKIVRNMLWQTYLWIRQERREPIDGLIRSFWYSHLKPVLDKVGLFNPEADQAATISEVLQDMVVDRGLFHYWDIGFLDDAAPYRRIGNKHPDVVFFTEKEGLFGVVNRAYEQWGVTVAALAGSPRLITSAYFVRELLAANFDLKNRPLYLFGYTDYDPAGTYAIAEAFRTQLEDEGATVALLYHITKPAEFTPQEIELYRYQIHANTARDRKLFARWKREGYDTIREGGKVYGITANSMEPSKARAVFYREAERYMSAGKSRSPMWRSRAARVDFRRWPGPPPVAGRRPNR